MKKVTIAMFTILFIFCCICCGIFMHRYKNLNIGTLSSLAETQANRHSNININNEGKLNINKATVEELCALNGIGEVLAARIIQYREEFGPYQTAEDLINVKGIGEVKLKNIIDYIYVD